MRPELEDRYDVDCSECGYEFAAAPSLAHRIGMAKHGSGRCPSCDTFLSLEFNETWEFMTSQPFERRMDEVRKAKVD